MANIKNLNDYLKTDATLNAAKKKLAQAKSDLTTQTTAKNAVKKGTPSYDDVMTRYDNAVKANNTAQADFNSAKTKATAYFNANKESILAKTKATEAKTDQERLTDAEATKDRLEAAGQSTVVLEKSIIDLKDKIAGTGKYAPTSPKDASVKDGDKATGSQVVFRDYQAETIAAPNKIATLSETERKNLAKQLNKVYKSKLPEDGLWSQGLVNAYSQAVEDNFKRSLAFNEEISFANFLLVADKEGTYRSATGGAGGVTRRISNATEADALVNTAFKSELGRDATSAELLKYRTILNKEQEKNPTKTVNGRTTGGINEAQFLRTELGKLPEFTKKKTDKASLTSQSLLGTAKANGITLGQDQINNFTKQIQDGTDIKVIQNQIRSIASSGMPDNVKKLLNEGIDLDTVYSPYRNTMAQILELNPESIDLKDPTLRLAFGPDKETTIYDFEKALRKDFRWQYTDNAKRDVSNVALKILRDFGFQA